MRSRAAPPAPPPLLQPAPEPAYEGEDEEDLYYDDDEAYYYDRSQPSLLSNPYLLAAIVVLGAVIAAVFIVFAFGRGDDTGGTGGTRSNVGVTPVASSEPGVPGIGLVVDSIATATVRDGPGRDYLELGLLQEGQKVNIVGRNEDASWLQIIFPANSQLRGWVPNSALDVPDDILTSVELADESAIDRPTAAVPTEAPRATAVATSTSTPGDEADIGIIIVADCSQGSEIVVQLTNTGTVEFAGQPVNVTVSNGGDVEYDKTLEADMAPGAGATLRTGVEASPPNMTVTVALEGMEDVDASNNVSSCAVSGGGGGGNNNRNNDNEDEEDEDEDATPTSTPAIPPTPD